MTEPRAAQDADLPGDARIQSPWLRKLPYIAVLTLAVAGVAFTNISQHPLFGYWEFLALAIAVVCVVTGWNKLDDKKARFRLLWMQALHWGAFLVTMNIVLLPGVQRTMAAPANGLVILILLALGTFVAGVNLLSLEISFLGLAMALAVPAITWLKQSALFFVLAVALLIGIGMTFWPRKSDRRVANSSENADLPG